MPTKVYEAKAEHYVFKYVMALRTGIQQKRISLNEKSTPAEPG